MNLTQMTLLTRMIIGWVGPLAWIVAQILDYKNQNPLIFLGGLLLSYWLRYVVHPKIPRSNWPRRAAAVVGFFIGALIVKFVFGLKGPPSSALFKVMMASMVVWLILDDIRIYRQMRATGAA